MVTDEFRAAPPEPDRAPHTAVARFEQVTVAYTQPVLPGACPRRRAARGPPSAVRIVVPTIGGGFGGKLDALLEPLVCVLAPARGPAGPRAQRPG
ncbi:molybdopterin-dependent oxidoreductase [Pseudonocardia sp. MCCB 268]|nr:molybdopterin-dependent oxidoreductase [Pseudonocardia cytotoxica]